MNREVPLEDNTYCDNCGQFRSCFDFMGDLLCTQCAKQLIDNDEDDKEEE